MWFYFNIWWHVWSILNCKFWLYAADFVSTKSWNRLFHTVSYRKYAINLISIVFIHLFCILSNIHCIFFAFKIKRWNGAYNNLSLMRVALNIFKFYSNKNLKWFTKRLPIDRTSSRFYIFLWSFIDIAFNRYAFQIKHF